MNTRRPGMMEVARLAGVSHQTVSRVLNDRDKVRPATRERVLDAISELGYRPNLTARALVTQQSSLLGVVWTGAGFYGPASTVSSIGVAARRAGWASLMAAVQDESDVTGVLSEFWDRGVEGLVVVTPHDGMAEVLRTATRGLPTVVVADLGQDDQFHVVGVDQRLGAELATRHLIDGGARSIAHISGPLDWIDARNRIQGWRATMDADRASDSPLLVGDWTAETAARLTDQLIDEGLPDAIFCGNDMTALAVLSRLRAAGIEVPGEVAVVGYDDIDGSAWASPSLTTVRQPFAAVGELCMEVLLRAAGGDAPTVHRIPPTLMVRASS